MAKDITKKILTDLAAVQGLAASSIFGSEGINFPYGKRLGLSKTEKIAKKAKRKERKAERKRKK